MGGQPRRQPRTADLVRPGPQRATSRGVRRLGADPDVLIGKNPPMIRHSVLFLTMTGLAGLLASPPARAQEYDIVLRGGTVYDGSGGPPVVADVAIRGDTIAVVG